MDRKQLLIAGGAGVVGIGALLYLRSRAPQEDDGGGDVLGGGTLLFTPPAPLAAPGAGNWTDGPVPQVTAGSTSLGDALLQQDMNATELGKASLLSQLASQFLAQLPTGKSALDSWRYTSMLGGVAFEQSFAGGSAAVNYGITDAEMADYNALAGLGASSSELSQFREQYFFGSGVGAVTSQPSSSPGTSQADSLRATIDSRRARAAARRAARPDDAANPAPDWPFATTGLPAGATAGAPIMSQTMNNIISSNAGIGGA